MRWPWSDPPAPQPDAALLARLQALEQHQEQPKDPDLIARVEELEDKARRIERRFVKLQGEFSAYQRDYYSRDDEDDYPEELDDDDRQEGPRRAG